MRILEIKEKLHIKIKYIIVRGACCVWKPGGGVLSLHECTLVYPVVPTVTFLGPLLPGRAGTCLWNSTSGANKRDSSTSPWVINTPADSSTPVFNQVQTQFDCWEAADSCNTWLQSGHTGRSAVENWNGVCVKCWDMCAFALITQVYCRATGPCKMNIGW